MPRKNAPFFSRMGQKSLGYAIVSGNGQELVVYGASQSDPAGREKGAGAAAAELGPAADRLRARTRGCRSRRLRTSS
jgi:hypothetical protein